ncbi:MAG: PAS domain-containing protein [Verrucomicrobiae bacterium]|nr:PAS domain-containing protein [Verrucomicrobiae bacterium]
METTTLWKQLWDYDPNGLLVLDKQLKIIVVNPALCRMLRTTAGELMGHPGAEVLGDVAEFRQALATGQKVEVSEREFPRYDLYVRTLIFPIPAEEIAAGIFVDLTLEWKQERELNRLKQEAMQEVRLVVDKQMRVAQEIAGLLGETTAETKVSLLRLLDMLGKEKG